MAVLVGYFFVQAAVLVAYLIGARALGVEAAPPDSTQTLVGVPHPGLALGLSVLVAAPVVVLAVIFLARYRNPSWKQLLGLSWPAGRQALGWGAATLVFLLAYDGIGQLLDRPLVPDFMVEAYSTAYFLPILYLALVVGAPLFEEILFRGFLLPSVAGTRLGAVGAVVATSLVWTVIHVQYDLFDLTGILILGLGFGFLRIHTGSTLLAIALHALINLAATLEVGWILRS